MPGFPPMPPGPRLNALRAAMAKTGFARGRVAGKRGPGARRLAPKKALTRIVKSVLNRQLETKYVAQQINLAGYTIPGSIQPSLDYHLMLPALLQQGAAATSNTREGDKIEPTRARISGHVWYDNLDTVVGNVVFVKLFFVTPKNIKSANAANTMNDGLLENGSADPVQWTAAGQDLQAFYPVCKENYTVLTTRTFKFTKNGGLPIGNQPGHDTNLGRDRYSFSYSWKPPALKYALDADQQPTNHLPVMFAVAYSPGFNYTTDASLVGQVKMNWNIEMFFKDA